MMSKKYLNNLIQAVFIVIALAVAISFYPGCTTNRYHPEKPDSVSKSPSVKQSPPPNNRDLRRMSSDSLTRDGIILYKKGDLEGAIRTLERAVSMNPYDGISFFYLAEAWIGKNNYQLAYQYNKLAEIHLKPTRSWSDRLSVQKKNIEKKIKP